MQIFNKLRHFLKNQEKIMADFSKLNDDIAALSAKVDARNAADAAKDARIAELEAQLADGQPVVDAADTALQAIAAKLP